MGRVHPPEFVPGGVPLLGELSPLLTVSDAAELLRVSKPTIYRLIRQQGLPVVRLMADIRLDPDDIAAWVESRKVAAL